MPLSPEVKHVIGEITALRQELDARGISFFAGSDYRAEGVLAKLTSIRDQHREELDAVIAEETATVTQ